MEYIKPELRLEFREFCVSLYLRQIDDIFSMAGFAPREVPQERSVSGDRRYRVQQYFEGIDWESPDDARRFLRVIGLVLSQTYVDSSQKESLARLCERSGLTVNGAEVFIPEDLGQESNLFKKQFPAGIPFGRQKPSFAITATIHGQSLQYEPQSGQGIINDDVYPDFTFQLFQDQLGIPKAANLTLKKSLLSMNQTEHERTFMQTYARQYNMAEAHVPLLIPQAWIQWHSATKRDLRDRGASHGDELYRVDFVAFWSNRRYVVLIDDISHYARKSDSRWFADEEIYSMRLKEDRRLQKQGWRVFRISNWEVKREAILQDAVNDFGDFVGLDAGGDTV
ncbi:conserved hypothetical protein [Thiocapsa sp. KS1]|nr:conserved hypothetical protein [Thiocapsa sp. KS1]